MRAAIGASGGLPRLLAGLEPGLRAPLCRDQHEQLHGPLPQLAPGRLIELVERSGLRGRGGADFPTAVKLSAVAAGRRPSAVVVNGSETEPASGKDALLLSRLPHLVLDGAELAAEAIGAREVIVKVSRSSKAIPVLRAAIAERRLRRLSFELAISRDGYVTGEESAVVRFLGGGDAIPAFVPPRPFERGYRGRPTLIQNPETLAQLALIARHGPAWYRGLGTRADPGTVLVTISGAVARPVVCELAFGTAIAEVIAAAGGATEPLRAVLIGGYFGTWLPIGPGERGIALRLARDELEQAGCSLGAGVIIALGESACGLHESARIIEYLAGESSGQCGPCVHGLAAIAGAFSALVDGSSRDHESELRRLERWCGDVRGRGACHHPTGVVRLVQSALTVFAPELRTHGHVRCAARPLGLPLARTASAPADGTRPGAGAGARARKAVR